jgi:hypothetical protein
MPFTVKGDTPIYSGFGELFRDAHLTLFFQSGLIHMMMSHGDGVRH